jgi:hypothetical protein
MANKICSRKEKCVNGNVPQDYSNFNRWPVSNDGHKQQCKHCEKAARDKKKQKSSEDQLRYLIFGH